MPAFVNDHRNEFAPPHLRRRRTPPRSASHISFSTEQSCHHSGHREIGIQRLPCGPYPALRKFHLPQLIVAASSNPSARTGGKVNVQLLVNSMTTRHAAGGIASVEG